MNQLQQEIEGEATSVPVQLVGVNQDGFQTDCNAPGAFCDGRDLPFLEEGPGDSVWAAWGVTYRDVFVLDEDNEVVAVFNLTQNGLADPANYEALKAIILDAANAP